MNAPKPAEEKYTCSVCGNTYTKPEGYDAIALEKMKERYGDIPEGERAIVCDNCWREAEPVLKQLDFKANDEMLRLLQVVRDMQKRGHKVVGFIGVKRDPKGDEEMELVWGTAEDDITDELERRLVQCIQNPDKVGSGTVRVVAHVDEKEGLTWSDKPWKEIN